MAEASPTTRMDYSEKVPMAPNPEDGDGQQKLSRTEPIVVDGPLNTRGDEFIARGVSPALFLLYLLLLALLLIQLAVILFNHSHLGGLPMFDTIFLLIVRADLLLAGRWPCRRRKRSCTASASVDDAELAPFLRVIGCCAFQALLFVTLTHALEAITCSDSSSHFSTAFLATVALNLVAKLPLAISLAIPSGAAPLLALAELAPTRRLFLHFGAPIIILALATANHYLSPENCELITRLDPYLGAVMCLLLSLTVAPIFTRNLPFLLLCDAPKGVREEEFRTEIEQKFPAIRCSHLHIFRKWPGHRFDALLHVQLQQQNDDPSGQKNGERQEEQRLQQLMRALHALLRGRGARRVAIQPWLAVHGEQPKIEQKQDQEWTDKACCPGAEESASGCSD